MPVSTFLADYWQKRPIALRRVFPPDFCPITPADLQEYATFEDADSRLIISEDWPPELNYGPFERAEFQDLPSRDWTLLVQEMDRLCPAVAAIQDHFRFVPNWRLDDVMVSYAATGGGVGAHTDQYDVFLIQGRGRRRWDIGLAPITDPEWKEDSEVAVLDHFEPDASWVLEPGDVLYLPPHFAHDGVALDECMTLSVGFRAPNATELLEACLEFMAEEDLAAVRYLDQSPKVEPDPGRLQDHVLRDLRAEVRDLLSDDDLLNHWIARRLTEPMRGHATGPETVASSGPGRSIRPVSSAQVAYMELESSAVLYVAGEAYELPAGCVEDLAALTGPGGLPSSTNMHPDLATLITELLEEGLLRTV